MNNFKFYFQKNKAIIFLALGLALSSGIAGYEIFTKLKLEEQFQQQTNEIKDAKENVVALNKKIDGLQPKLLDAENDVLRLQKENSTLQSEIEAFAKQAAACNAIKKRLHIKE